MKRIATTASILLLGLIAARASAAGNTTVTQNNPTYAKDGNNYIISDDGTCSIDSTVQSFNGLSLTGTDPNGGPIQGYVGLPKGNPTPGGAAVPWTGQLAPVILKGKYTVIITMSYTDANGVHKIFQSTKSVTVQ